MTFEEFGMRLRASKPALNAVPLTNEQLALWVAEEYDLWDLISTTARRIKDISERRPRSDRWTEKGRLESIQQMVAINREEAASLLEMDVSIRAAGEGVTLHVYEELRTLDHKHGLQKDLMTHEYELERKKDNDALDAGNRELLTNHELIEDIEKRLMDAIDRHDAETHPVKKRALAIRVDRLMEELDGRTTTAAVQASNRSRLDSKDENSNGTGNSQPEAEANPEQISSANPGTGKRRAGYTS